MESCISQNISCSRALPEMSHPTRVAGKEMSMENEWHMIIMHETVTEPSSLRLRCGFLSSQLPTNAGKNKFTSRDHFPAWVAALYLDLGLKRLRCQRNPRNQTSTAYWNDNIVHVRNLSGKEGQRKACSFKCNTWSGNLSASSFPWVKALFYFLIRHACLLQRSALPREPPSILQRED